MKLRHATPVAVMSCVAAVVVIVGLLAYQNAEDTVAWAKQKQLASIATLVDIFLREQARQSTAAAELLAAIPLVGELSAKGDRNGLARILVPGYQKASIKYGAESGAIVTLPATMFLRLHAPEQFGDDQSASRPILVFANQTHEVQSGLEIGQSAGIRGVAPIYAGTSHVGALEWSSGLGPMIAELKTVTSAEFAIMLKETAVPADSAIRRNEARKISDFIAAEVTDWAYLSQILSESDLYRTGETGYSVRSLRGVDVGIIRVPLFDFNGRSVGAVIAVKEVNEYSRALKDTGVRLAMACIIGVIIIAGVVLLIIKVMLICPIDRLRDRLHLLSRGDFSTKVEGVGRRDEIGELAISIESVRLDLLRRFAPGAAPPLAMVSGEKPSVAAEGPKKKGTVVAPIMGVIGPSRLLKEDGKAGPQSAGPQSADDQRAPEAARGSRASAAPPRSQVLAGKTPPESQPAGDHSAGEVAQ